ncbi:MAG: ComEA family DNA-binding protein [Candidatus Eiseniibacteriota bacterium]
MLTAAERRGALVLAFLLTLGTGWDLWQARRPPRALPASARLAPPETIAAPAAAPEPDSPAAGDSRKHAPAQPLDLNRAAAGDLARLPGIGPVLAARILAERSARGEFSRPEDLLSVRGIGPRLFERLRPHLRLASRRDTADTRTNAFRTGGGPDSVQILLQSRAPAFR